MNDTNAFNLANVDGENDIDFDDVAAYSGLTGFSMSRIVALMYGNAPAIPEPQSLALAVVLTSTLAFSRCAKLRSDCS